MNIESDADADAFIEVSAGTGLYLTAVAGLIGIITALRLKRKTKEDPPDAAQAVQPASNG